MIAKRGNLLSAYKKDCFVTPFLSGDVEGHHDDKGVCNDEEPLRHFVPPPRPASPARGGAPKERRG